MEVTVNDFLFRAFRRFRFFNAFNESKDSKTNNYHLLTVSNEFGLIFVAQGKELKVVETNFVHDNAEITKQNAKQDVVNFPCKQISLDFEIIQIRCNSDSSVLAVLVDSAHGPFALFYDVRYFHPKINAQPKPFCQFRLSSNADAKVVCFEWNPTSADIFSFCCSDGNLAIVQINDKKSVSILASLAPAAAKPTCLSWSPKGKQIVVGYDDCTFCQYKPNLQPVKKVEAAACESILEFKPNSIVSICWLSTTHFAVLYKSPDRISLCHVTIHKDGPPAFLNCDDVCFGRGTDFSPRYYFLHVPEWSMLICSSTTSNETAVLGYNADEKAWQLWNLDDAGRAELPLDQKDQLTYPLGVALDTTSQKPLILPEKSLPPAPVLLTLSSDGLLCPFSMLNLKNGANHFCKPPANQVAVPNDVAAVPSVKHKLSQLPADQLTIPQQTPAAGSTRVMAVPQKQKEEAPNVEDQKLLQLRKEVNRNIHSVEEDLRKLKLKLASPMPVSLDNKNLLIDLTRRIDQNCTSIDNLEIDLNNVSEKLLELRHGITDAWVFAEELNQSINRLNSREMKYFWKTRPLSASNKKILDDFRTKINYFEENLNEACVDFAKFQTENLSRDKSKSGQRSGSLVYKTLANIQAVIAQQKQRLPELQRFAQSIDVAPKPVDVSFDLSITKDSDSVRSLSTVAVDQSALKRFMMSRSGVPRRTTTPSNFMQIFNGLRQPTLTIKMEENNFTTPKVESIERKASSENSITVETSIKPEHQIVTSSAFTVVPRSPALEISKGFEKPKPSQKVFAEIPPKQDLMKNIEISKQVPIKKDNEPQKEEKVNIPAQFGGFTVPRTSTAPAATTQSSFLVSSTKQQNFSRPVPMTNTFAEVTSPVVPTSSSASTPIVKPVPLSSTPVPVVTSSSFPVAKPNSDGFSPSALFVSSSAPQLAKSTPAAKFSFSTDPFSQQKLPADDKQPDAVKQIVPLKPPSEPSVAQVPVKPIEFVLAKMQETKTPAETPTAKIPVETPIAVQAATEEEKTKPANPAQSIGPKNNTEMENLEEMETVNPAASVQSALSSFSFTSPARSTPQAQGIFGGGFMSGLGAKPSADAAATASSPFGPRISFGSPTTTITAATNLFAPATLSASAGVFGAPSSTKASAVPSGFGSAATFGGFASASNTSPPAGSSSLFGVRATFGGGSQFASPFASGSAGSPSGSVFGGGAGFGSPNASASGRVGFAAFANIETPTFGSLAGGGSPPSFGSLGGIATQTFGSMNVPPAQTFGTPNQQPFGTQQPASGQQGFGGPSTFGNSPATFGSLGSGSASPSTFGSFGSPQQQPNQSSPQFSQWRG